jgi:hypothetical protein
VEFPALSAHILNRFDRWGATAISFSLNTPHEAGLLLNDGKGGDAHPVSMEHILSSFYGTAACGFDGSEDGEALPLSVLLTTLRSHSLRIEQEDIRYDLWTWKKSRKAALARGPSAGYLQHIPRPGHAEWNSKLMAMIPGLAPDTTCSAPRTDVTDGSKFVPYAQPSLPYSSQTSEFEAKCGILMSNSDQPFTLAMLAQWMAQPGQTVKPS